MSTGNVLLGTLAGLAIGALAGILFAPERGSITRKQILYKSDDYLEQLKSKVDEISVSLKHKFESTKKDAENLVDKGKTLYDDVRKDVKNAATNYKHDKAADFNRATS